jgi:hypothetical protein
VHVGQDRPGLAEPDEEPGFSRDATGGSHALGGCQRPGALREVLGAEEVAMERPGEQLVRALQRAAEPTFEGMR